MKIDFFCVCVCVWKVRVVNLGMWLIWGCSYKSIKTGREWWGWHHPSFTSHQTDSVYQTSPEGLFFFILSFVRLQSLTPNLLVYFSDCPWNCTAVFVITSSPLIDVSSDLLIFHEFPLCFNWAASPIACVNCSWFAPERFLSEQWGHVFVDGKKKHN